LAQSITGSTDTELLIADMWMGDMLIRRCCFRVKSDDVEAIAVAVTYQLPPVKHEVEGTEFEVLQGNGLSGNAQELDLPVDLQLTEVGFQLLQFGHQVGQHGRRRGRLLNGLTSEQGSVLQRSDRVEQFALQLRNDQCKVVCLSLGESLSGAFHRALVRD